MLETIAFAISLVGVIASVTSTSTFSFPLVSGVFLSYVVMQNSIKGNQVIMSGSCGDGSFLVSS